MVPPWFFRGLSVGSPYPLNHTKDAYFERKDEVVHRYLLKNRIKIKGEVDSANASGTQAFK